MTKAKSSITFTNKIIRDGFSMPTDENELIAKIQASLAQRGIVATKSKVLRAALHALMRLPSEERGKILKDLPSIRAGRPPSNKS